MSGELSADELPEGYRPLSGGDLRDYLADDSALRGRLGGDPQDWSVIEVSDGNLNLVHMVSGPAGRLCTKQALPHVRVDEDWRLPLDRSANESAYLTALAPHVGATLPTLYHYDPTLFLIVMEALIPHRILRQDLIDGHRVPGVAETLGHYVARASFFTSDLYLPLEKKFNLLAAFTGNHALKRISAELIFQDPYRDHPRNRWTSPYLDELVAEIRRDPALKLAASRLGARFLGETQALIHGDLHTGSVMATSVDHRVIDPEFSAFGPIGLDLGAFVANLLMAYFAQDGLPGDRIDHADWILQQIPAFWTSFRAEFLALWHKHGQGDAYPAALFVDPGGQEALASERERYLSALFDDLLGYAAVKIIRRITGFAHVADFETIAEPSRRALCEARALRLAISLLRSPDAYPDISALLSAARQEASHV